MLALFTYHCYYMIVTESMSQIELAKRSTPDVYERQARYWDEIRSTSLYEKPWLDRFLSTLPVGGKLLDLGCGSGVPVAGYFLDRGYSLVGVDYADTMIELARLNYPLGEWYVQDINHLAINVQFDGIYSWDGFFHLSVEEQRASIPKLSKLVKRNGAIMLTVGTGEGEVTGTVGGETVYHASLSPEEYETLFRKNGFGTITYVPEDDNCRGRSVLLASDKHE